MPHLDLNVTEMRRQVLEEQHKAMRPFQERLRQLDALEDILNQQKPVKADEQALPKFWRGTTKRIAKTKANGAHQPYRNLSQPDAVRMLLAEEPGLNASQITAKLQAGGYPFTSADPRASLATSLRSMAQAGRIYQLKPPSHKDGQMNLYYLEEPK